MGFLQIGGRGTLGNGLRPAGDGYALRGLGNRPAGVGVRPAGDGLRPAGVGVTRPLCGRGNALRWGLGD